MKNNNGFTLVELLAVIVVLGVVLTIVIRSVMVSMEDAKKEIEKVFVSKLEDAIEQYIDLKKSDIVSDGISGTIKKVTSSNQTLDDEEGLTLVNVYKMKHKEDRKFTFQDIINTGFIKESDLVNPAKEDVSCGNPGNIFINIYRDTDFVYYFQTNDLACVDLKDEDGNSIDDINTLPESYRYESGEDE